MQATVSAFDPASGTGRVLLDDGIELGFTGEVFRASGLRHLRPGQRVRIEVAGTGGERRVGAVQILTLPDEP